MRVGHTEVCGCFPTGRHYPGIAERIAHAVEAIAGLWDGLDAAVAWAEAPFAVIDFETTGLDPDHDRILEVGIVCFDGGAVTKSHGYLVDPGIPVPEEARAIHGIRDEDLRDAPRIEQLMPTLIEALDGRLPVAYNAGFDRRFLHAEAARLPHIVRAPLPPALLSDVHWIDPLVWVRELQKEEKSKKLVDVCARMGIALEDAHRAAADAEATGKVLLALAPEMPRRYGELIRIQGRYAAQQDAEAAAWRSRRTP